MEKVREEEEELKNLYQTRSKKYKPFGFESKFKLSFLIFFLKKRSILGISDSSGYSSDTHRFLVFQSRKGWAESWVGQAPAEADRGDIERIAFLSHLRHDMMDKLQSLLNTLIITHLSKV